MSSKSINFPPHFPMSMNADAVFEQLQQLEPYYLYLARHAAFPPALTPDLLYCLRDEFDRDEQGNTVKIPWIAVADLLLSGLFEEASDGREVYKMRQDVRTKLQKQLQENSKLGSDRIQQLSKFLLEYAKQKLIVNDPYLQDLYEFQWWTALVHIQVDRAKQRLEQSLWQAYELSDRQNLEKVTEFLARLEKEIEEFDEQLLKLEPLFICAKRIKKRTSGDLTEEDDLASEVNVDYRKLQTYLRQGKWKEADQETKRLLLEVAAQKATSQSLSQDNIISRRNRRPKTQQYWLSHKDIRRFPSIDLNTIDCLWYKYSDGRFGFSVQKKIWHRLGATKKANYLLWKLFAQQVGWWVNFDWFLWDELIFSISAAPPKGHLPALSWWSVLAGWDRWWVWGGRWKNINSFFDRISFETPLRL